MNPNNPLVSCSSLNGYIHHTTFRSTRSSVGASFGLSTDNSRSWYVQVWWDRCSRSLVLGSHSSRSSRSRQLALYYCFPRKSSRTTLFTSEVDSSFELADCWSALSSVGEPDQFSHLPIFHIDSLYFEFRADCSAVAVDLITFSFSNQERAFTYSILGTESLIYPWQTSQLFLRRAWATHTMQWRGNLIPLVFLFPSQASPCAMERLKCTGKFTYNNS